jgi:hypothetical protein
VQQRLKDMLSRSLGARSADAKEGKEGKDGSAAGDSKRGGGGTSGDRPVLDLAVQSALLDAMKQLCARYRDSVPSILECLHSIMLNSKRLLRHPSGQLNCFAFVKRLPSSCVVDVDRCVYPVQASPCVA